MAPRLDQTKRSLPHSGPPEHKACVSRAEALHAYPRVSRLSLAFFRTHHHPLRPPIARGENAACARQTFVGDIVASHVRLADSTV